jgi:hypothetical protein
VTALILGHWRLALGLAVAALLALYIGVLKGELQHERGLVAGQEVEIGQLRVGVAQRDASIALQNSAVEALRRASDQATVKLAQAQAASRAVVSQGIKRAQELLDEKIPQQPRGSDSSPGTQSSTTVEVSCEDSIQWLRSKAPVLSGW